MTSGLTDIIGPSRARVPLIRGTLEVLILKALSVEPLHGVGVSRRIEQMSGNAYAVRPGSYVPAIRRLRRKGWLDVHRGESEHNRRAKYYRLTESGRKELRHEIERWNETVAVMRRALRQS